MDRVLSKGASLKIANHELQVSRLNACNVDPDKMKYLPAIVEKDSVSSSDISGKSGGSCGSGGLLKEATMAAVIALASASASTTAHSVSTNTTFLSMHTTSAATATTPSTTIFDKKPLQPPPPPKCEERVMDKRRVLLLNVPDDIDYDYLELYLEYLSDEVEVECIDYAREMLNSIVATFVRDIGTPCLGLL